MTTPAPDYSGLIERLEAEIGDQHLMPGSLIRDAHAAIRDLEADRERLAKALERVSDGGLFRAIAHGDDEHRAWLDEAITDYIAGRPVQRVRGGGKGTEI